MLPKKLNGTVADVAGKILHFRTQDGSMIKLVTQEVTNKIGSRIKSHELINKQLSVEITFGTKGAVAVVNAAINT